MLLNAERLVLDEFINFRNLIKWYGVKKGINKCEQGSSNIWIPFINFGRVKYW